MMERRRIKSFTIDLHTTTSSSTNASSLQSLVARASPHTTLPRSCFSRSDVNDEKIIALFAGPREAIAVVGHVRRHPLLIVPQDASIGPTGWFRHRYAMQQRCSGTQVASLHRMPIVISSMFFAFFADTAFIERRGDVTYEHPKTTSAASAVVATIILNAPAVDIDCMAAACRPGSRPRRRSSLQSRRDGRNTPNATGHGGR